MIVELLCNGLPAARNKMFATDYIATRQIPTKFEFLWRCGTFGDAVR